MYIGSIWVLFCSNIVTGLHPLWAWSKKWMKCYMPINILALLSSESLRKGSMSACCWSATLSGSVLGEVRGETRGMRKEDSKALVECCNTHIPSGKLVPKGPQSSTSQQPYWFSPRLFILLFLYCSADTYTVSFCFTLVPNLEFILSSLLMMTKMLSTHSGSMQRSNAHCTSLFFILSCMFYCIYL